MNILVIGSGGREHALVMSLKRSPLVNHIYCAPGNAGIGQQAEIVPIQAKDLAGLLTFAKDRQIDLTVVGPEQPLSEGIVDLFNEHGLRIFGPSKAAADLEVSKVFAKNFMGKYGIPTAHYSVFSSAEKYDAERYINEIPTPIVIKADGLAAGKGVTVCETKEKALEIIDLIFTKKEFGDAGNKIVIEEFLVGEEASVFALTDGSQFVVLSTAQDHKRIFDGDKGKNTGGMGAYSPAPIVDEEIMEKVKRLIIAPTLRGMAEEGRPYRGCLYIGLMITETGPKVIEFNCRFGDPETQVVLPLLESDLVQLMMDTIKGTLAEHPVIIKNKTAVCVVIASGGYPDRYNTDKLIYGLDTAASEKDVLIFHAGTKMSKDGIVTAGGRVLGVTALGGPDDLENTISKAYSAVEKVTFDGAYYRSDIGKKGLDFIRRLKSKETQ
jgi:phosphoribosylamine---glycine ligase